MINSMLNAEEEDDATFQVAASVIQQVRPCRGLYQRWHNLRVRFTTHRSAEMFHIYIKQAAM